MCNEVSNVESRQRTAEQHCGVEMATFACGRTGTSCIKVCLSTAPCMFSYCISLGNIDVAKTVALHVSWVHVQPMLYGELLLCFLEGALLFIHFFMQIETCIFHPAAPIGFFFSNCEKRRNT